MRVVFGAFEVILHQIDFGQLAIGGRAILHRAGRPTERFFCIHEIAHAARNYAVEIVSVGVVHHEVERAAGVFQSLGILGATIINRGGAREGAHMRGVALDALQVLSESLAIVALALGAFGGLIQSFERGAVVIVEVQWTLQNPILRIVGISQ